MNYTEYTLDKTVCVKILAIYAKLENFFFEFVKMIERNLRNSEKN